MPKKLYSILVPMSTDNVGPSRGEKCLSCCKTFVAFMFSHVGLCGLVVLYAMLGGLTFEKIESAKEKGTKQEGEALCCLCLWGLVVLYTMLGGLTMSNI